MCLPVCVEIAFDATGPGGSDAGMGGKKDSDFWTALHDELGHALANLPPAQEPEIVPYSHPDELWKEEAQIEQAEEDIWIETEELVRHFCAHREWPKQADPRACHFVEARIKWGLKFTRWLTIPCAATGGPIFERPKASGYAVVEWLLIDVYARRFPPAPPAPFYVSTGDGTIKSYFMGVPVKGPGKTGWGANGPVPPA